MTSVVDFEYDKNGTTIERIDNWGFGRNWPVVYIIYNESKAYVGETLDAVRRTEQHFSEQAFNEFSSICLISNRTFNKSVVLDLESFLIKYMSADKGGKELINGNAGVVDHNYFYKEAYEEEFRDIWDKLFEIEIVKNSIQDIENSELYKYSPYKTLNREQQNAAFDILQKLSKINAGSSKSLITVTGGAGTGKTILAVYMVKLLVDIIANKRVWINLDDPEAVAFIQRVSKKLTSINMIGFVVPMVELRKTMKDIFNSIDGLSDSMVLAPEEVAKNRYDVLIVDEAHRLYRRKNLPGSHLYNKFDAINRRLMGDKFTKSENDYTELDWIIENSRIQVLFYDKYQTIRATDIGPLRFDSICKPHIYKYIELLSQMRCKGGNGYYEYIRDVLTIQNMDITEYQHFDGYELKVVDNIQDLFFIIREKKEKEDLCKIVTGPGWGKEEAIEIEGEKYRWASGKDDHDCNVIFSIHKTQGFDLNYAGVIFGKEVYYDEELEEIQINKKELKDNHTKSNGDDSMRRYILNIYLTLMTRGIKGTYVYAVDEKLREYLRKMLN